MLTGHLRSLWATDWATRGVAQLSEGLSRDVAPGERNDRPERRKPHRSRAFSHAPKRTRTSTRLSRTRPSTWLVRTAPLLFRTLEPRDRRGRATHETYEQGAVVFKSVFNDGSSACR